MNDVHSVKGGISQLNSTNLAKADILKFLPVIDTLPLYRFHYVDRIITFFRMIYHSLLSG
jgi:hypothetical protein